MFMEIGKLPDEYILICAVNKKGKDSIISENLIATLFSEMQLKWLPLSAYKTNTDDTGEERLFIAYNPHIIDRSKVNQIEGEITEFFHNISPSIVLEFGSKVKWKPRKGYKNAPKITNKSEITIKSSSNISTNPNKKIAKEALIDIVTDLYSCEKARSGKEVFPLARVHCLFDGKDETFWFTSKVYHPRELSDLNRYGHFVPRYSDVAIRMQKYEVGKSFTYSTTNRIKRLKEHHVLLENQSNLQDHTIAIAGHHLKYQFRDLQEFLGALRQNRDDIRDINDRIKALETQQKEKKTSQEGAKINKNINDLQAKYRILTQQQADLKNITIYIRKQGEMRYSLIVDPIQTRIMSQNLYDGKTLIIQGGPGTGKTTTMIHRLSYLTDTFAIEEDDKENFNKYKLTSLQRKHLLEAINENRDWMFFSPSQMLKDYLADAMKKEELENTSEKVWYWKEYCRMILQDNYRLLESNENNAPFKICLSKEPLFYKESDIINDFVQFYLGQYRKIKDQLPPLSKDGNVYAWTAIAQNIRKRFDNADHFDLAHFASLFNNLESVYGNDCKKLLQERKSALSVLSENICAILDENKVAKNEIEDIFDLATDILPEDDVEDEEVKNETEEMAGITGKLKKWLKIHPTNEQEEKEQSELSIKIQKWLKSYCYWKVSGVDELSDEQKLIADVILPLIDNKFDREIKKIGELMIFDHYAKYTRGIGSIMLNVIPSHYKKFRIHLNKTKYEDCDQKLLRDIIQHKQGRELHHQEQSLLLGFINTLVKQIKISTSTKIKHHYIDAYEEVSRPIIGIDEATDFSVCDIYAMQSLLSREFNSLTLCGDMMQRMTEYGIKSWKELDGVLFNPITVEMKTSYRQSVKLLEVAKNLYIDTRHEKPSYVAYMKSNKVPAPLVYIDENELYKIQWISKRISEVYRAYGELLPSIAIFVTLKGYIPRFIELLQDTDFFKEKGIKVLDGTKPTSVSENHICVYPIEVVKGMEFDVVFFHNIDKTDKELNLVRRYIYVGVSRAAFFLGITMDKENTEISKYFVKNKDWFNI